MPHRNSYHADTLRMLNTPFAERAQGRYETLRV